MDCDEVEKKLTIEELSELTSVMLRPDIQWRADLDGNIPEYPYSC